MALATVSLALLASRGTEPEAAIPYALDLAARSGARLIAAVAVPPLAAPALAYSGYAVATQMLMVIERENAARKEDAEAKAEHLRAEAERRALVEGLASGIIDVIVSDHEGQDVETKRLPFAEAAPGAVGLETLLSAALRLVAAGDLTLPAILRAMSTRPAEILGLEGGRLALGAPADLIRFDPEEPYVLDPANLRSRCRNTPFDGARLEGVVKLTLVAGEIAHG